MFLQSATHFHCHPLSSLEKETAFGAFSVNYAFKHKCEGPMTCSSRTKGAYTCMPSTVIKFPWQFVRATSVLVVGPIKASSNEEVGELGFENGSRKEVGATHQHDSSAAFMDDEQERKEWRRAIRQVVGQNPHFDEETDPAQKRNKVQKLLAEYPLVVEEEDPDWPDDADGWGFNLGQFFDKITIKNVKRDDDDNYDSDKELVWQDDDYIRPVRHITTKEWEDTVFKDISPLVVFIHNRYRRPKENEEARDGLEKAAHIFWNSRLPSPRCVAIDAVVELDLVAALKVSAFPEIIFTKAGKILHREKSVRNADELSKMMAFFYYGATKPPCLDIDGDCLELIPSVPDNSEHDK